MQNVNLSVLFLSTMPMWLGVVLAIVALVVGVFVATLVYNATTVKKVGSAREQERKILDDARAEAERITAQGKEESKRALITSTATPPPATANP